MGARADDPPAAAGAAPVTVSSGMAPDARDEVAAPAPPAPAASPARPAVVSAADSPPAVVARSAVASPTPAARPASAPASAIPAVNAPAPPATPASARPPAAASVAPLPASASPASFAPSAAAPPALTPILQFLHGVVADYLVAAMLEQLGRALDVLDAGLPKADALGAHGPGPLLEVQEQRDRRAPAARLFAHPPAKVIGH